jgi:syntaxin 8
MLISPSSRDHSHSILFDTIQINADSLAEQAPAPYRDSPLSAEEMTSKAYEEGPDSVAVLQSQQQEMATQDNHLDALSASIGRQHHLSLQMSEELETHAELLEEMDTAVDSTTARLGRASRRLDKVSKSLKEHGETALSSLTS